MRAVALGGYDLGALEDFRARYIETAGENNTAAIVRFLCTLLPGGARTARPRETAQV